jgi:DNA-binding transcriptional regulator YhcF (GntR family)
VGIQRRIPERSAKFTIDSVIDRARFAGMRIEPDSPVPPFEQVRARFAADIGDGTLVAGARLPTVRRLADDLGLAVNTVARAYRALEAAGLIETRGRAGTVVSAAGDRTQQRLQAAAQDYARTAHDLGVPAEHAIAVVRAALGG